ncbi:MAG: outer membrane lipoprotein carrier protein LolA [Gammaproteobacteria bacterium]|nr:outer membrane lipoprotein carrier protein LolA [Gammaproteobacteria bacterium]
MKRIIGFVVALLLLPLPVRSDDASFKKIATGLSQAAVLRAQFTQTKTIPALTRPITTSGRFVYGRGQGVLWTVEQPYQARYALDENGVSEVGPSGTRLRAASQPGMQHVGRVLRALLEPDIAALEQYFTASTSGAANRWELLLTPKTALRQAFKTVRLRGGRFVEEVLLDEANGDTTLIRFRQTQEATSLDAAERRALARE